MRPSEGISNWRSERAMTRMSGSSQKVRRAQVLLKADADGPAWTDTRIAEAYGCRRDFQGHDPLGQEPQRPVREPRRRSAQPQRDDLRLLVAVEQLGPRRPRQALQGRFEPAGREPLAEVLHRLPPAISHETVRRTLKKTT